MAMDSPALPSTCSGIVYGNSFPEISFNISVITFINTVI